MVRLIVVADKDYQTSETITAFLRGLPVEVKGVASSVELKNALKAGKPDLLILNSILTDTPGSGATKKIVAAVKSSREYSDIPIIVMIEDRSDPHCGQLEQSGADVCVDKPLDAVSFRSSTLSLLHLEETEHHEPDEEEIFLDFESDDADLEQSPLKEDSPLPAVIVDEFIPEFGETESGDHREENLIETDPSTDNSTEEDLSDFDVRPFDLSEDTQVDQSPDKDFDQEAESSLMAGEPILEPFEKNSDFSDFSIDDMPTGFTSEPESPIGVKNTSTDGELGRLFGPAMDKAYFSATVPIEVLPSKEDLLKIFGRAIQSVLPSREDILSTVVDGIMARIPTKEEMLEKIEESIPTKERFQEILAASIATAIQDSLPERTWLESVSRGLFDQRTQGVLPDKDVVITIIRNEIRERTIETVEKMVRQMIDEISGGVAK
jgi:CheY-like chemotaxis protein